MDPAGGAALVTVASLNNWSLNQEREKVKVTAFGDVNHVYVQGLPDLTGTLAGFWDTADVSLFDAAEGEDDVTLKLFPNVTLDPSFFWQGLAFLDMSITVPGDGAVTIGGSFVAAAAWTRSP